MRALCFSGADRQTQRECGASAGCVCKKDISAVQRGQFLCHRETQPIVLLARAAFVGAVKALEHMCLFRIRHAGAVVLHRKQYPAFSARARSVTSLPAGA